MSSVINMLPIILVLVFHMPLVIGAIVSGFSKKASVRCFMTWFSFFPLCLAALLSVFTDGWKSLFRVEILVYANNYLLIYVIIRFWIIGLIRAVMCFLTRKLLNRGE